MQKLAKKHLGGLPQTLALILSNYKSPTHSHSSTNHFNVNPVKFGKSTGSHLEEALYTLNNKKM